MKEKNESNRSSIPEGVAGTGSYLQNNALLGNYNPSTFRSNYSLNSDLRLSSEYAYIPKQMERIPETYSTNYDKTDEEKGSELNRYQQDQQTSGAENIGFTYPGTQDFRYG